MDRVVGRRAPGPWWTMQTLWLPRQQSPRQDPPAVMWRTVPGVVFHLRGLLGEAKSQDATRT